MKIRTLAAVALAACSPEGPPPVTGAPLAVPPPPPPPAPSAPSAPAPGVVGSACNSEHPFAQGDCASGLMCGPGPGGYCLTFCGKGNACDGTCAESARAGEICMKRCTRDEDCREGYACDASWRVCSIHGVLAPKAPQCGAAPLAKKSFGPAVQLSTARSPGVYTFEPAAALTADGSVAVVYTTLGETKNALGSSTLATNGSVQGDRELVFGRENHFDPWMASDKWGGLHLVWLGFDGGHAPEKRMQIGYATSADGVTWSAPAGVNDVNTDCPGAAPGCLDKPMIAIGPDKKDPQREAIYVAYFSDPAEGTKLVRSADGGKTFGASVAVGPGAYGNLEVGADGDVHAVFVTESASHGQRTDMFGDARNAVEYAVSHDGGKSFDKPRRVSAEGELVPFFFSNPHVAADAKRKTLYVVYPAGTADGRWDIMLASSKDGGATWSRIQVNDDPHCANHMTPSVVVRSSTGELHVTWTEERDGRGRVAYAACVPGGASCSANEAVSDVPFAGYSLGRFSPRWLGEYGTVLVDEKRKKLHVVYTATVDEGGKAVSRIFTASRKL